MYYVVGHGPEMRGLVLEPESSDSGSNEPVQQNAENDDQGDLFQTEGSSEKESSSDETASETTDEYVNRVREEMITNPESVGETEPEQEAESTSADAEAESPEEEATTEEAEGESESSTDMVASGNNTPTTTDPTAQFYKDKQKQVEYMKITSWMNEFIEDLGALNSRFDGLLRKYKPGGISEALEKQNVEHRLNDIATECHWMLENVEKIGGIPDAE